MDNVEMNNVSNRIVVITGASSGIGKNLKELFKNNGDTVISIARTESDEENYYSADVAHEIKMRQVFDDIKNKFGKIDILINNAGVGLSGITELLNTEDIEHLVNVNYMGVLNCVRFALPIMNAGSKIINVSSAMALFPVPFRSVYGSLKSAVLNLSFSLRMELAPLGIDVCAICPGDVKTNFTNNRLKEFETTERYGDRIRTATEKSDSREEKRMSCQVCSDKMFKIINKKKLKPFYIIGGKYKFLYFITRITPKSWLLGITQKLYGGKQVDNKVAKQVKVENNVEENISDADIVSENAVTENKVAENKVEINTETNTNAETGTNAEVYTNRLNALSKLLNKNAEQKNEESEPNKEGVDENNSQISNE